MSRLDLLNIAARFGKDLLDGHINDQGSPTRSKRKSNHPPKAEGTRREKASDFFERVFANRTECLEASVARYQAIDPNTSEQTFKTLIISALGLIAHHGETIDCPENACPITLVLLAILGRQANRKFDLARGILVTFVLDHATKEDELNQLLEPLNQQNRNSFLLTVNQLAAQYNVRNLHKPNKLEFVRQALHERVLEAALYHTAPKTPSSPPPPPNISR